MINKKTRVGIIGCGAIGSAVCSAILSSLHNLELCAILGRDRIKTKNYVREIGRDVTVCEDARELASQCDLVIEAAPAEVFEKNIKSVVERGKTVLTVSAGALYNNWHLVELAKETGARFIVPTGALLGLDAVAAAAEGNINSIKMITTKPLSGLVGAPFLNENGIELTSDMKRRKLFDGTAAEAIVGFPANLNVAVALGLAGVGPEYTKLEIWADPNAEYNTHSITVDSDSALLEMKIQNIPSENPKTGKITALSVVAALRKIDNVVQIGT